MKKILAILLAAAMVLSLAACGSDAASTAGSAAAASGSEAPAASGSGNVLTVCLASEPDTLDPALNSAVDGGTMVSHLFSGLAKWAQGADGKLEIVPDARHRAARGRCQR